MPHTLQIPLQSVLHRTFIGKFSKISLYAYFSTSNSVPSIKGMSFNVSSASGDSSPKLSVLVESTDICQGTSVKHLSHGISRVTSRCEVTSIFFPPTLVKASSISCFFTNAKYDFPYSSKV